MARYKRRKKLIKPSLQFRLIGAFVALTAVALLLQFVLLGSRLSHLARSMPEGGDYLIEKLPGMLGGVLIFSFVALLPAVLGVGILVTFRIAGPVWRFEQHLASVARGEDPGPCRIRRGDELHALCHLINAALDAARRGPAQGAEGEGTPELAGAACAEPAEPRDPAAAA